jgi:hypothetical protein
MIGVKWFGHKGIEIDLKQLFLDWRKLWSFSSDAI